MEKVDILENAIKNRNPIKFDYTESNGTITNREGNPHVLYMYESVNEKKLSMKLGIFQTGGQSNSGLNKFKDFLSIENINNIEVFTDKIFIKDKLYYKSNSPRYKNVIQKI